MTPEAALAALAAAAEPGRAAGKAAYHKQGRPVLGVPNPEINALAAGWRRALSVDERIALGRALWQTDIFEARIAAAKVLDQRRIVPDAGVWTLIVGWVTDFDSWAIADHACAAGAHRLVADPARLAEVAQWASAGHMWTRRAAFVITLPFAKSRDPGPAEDAARALVLGWAADLVADHDWFIQKAIAWWLRDLSRRDPARTRAFLDEHGARMRGFARREAGKYLA